MARIDGGGARAARRAAGPFARTWARPLVRPWVRTWARLPAALCAGLLAAAPPGPAAADAIPAKTLFGARMAPSAGAPQAHGSYAAGCLAGGRALPEAGAGWQAMRLSRNRNWGHPETLAFIERLGAHARAVGWPGVLIGDISQPRGGPMLDGHRSHQIGMDIDVWMRPAPDRSLTRVEREVMGSPSVVAADRRSMSPAWTPGHAALLERAAGDPAVSRIFVNAAVKAELCRTAAGDRAWLRKIRPWWGHDHHFHVRLACPAGSPGCENQEPPPGGDGCDESLAWWFTEEALNPAPGPRPPEKTLADLPRACRALVEE